VQNFHEKKREYLEGKINDLKPKSKNRNFRDIHRGISELRRVTSIELT
jgi:hypothetical protein